MKNRRNFIKNSAAIAALSVVRSATAMTGSDPMEHYHSNKKFSPGDKQKKASWPLSESRETPKLCMMCSPSADEKTVRRIRQLGITYVNASGITSGWKESELRGEINYLKSKGLIVINKMHSVGINTVLGREGRDAEIAIFQESLRVAGACGLPTVEYNFYVDRLIEGYYEMPGRGGAGVTGYDYSKVKDLPAKPEIGVHRAEEIWANITYFLKAVIPVAEKAGVRMALHPNDPVAQVSHQSDQIMANLKGWKRLISIVDSPSNGITFDPGVTTEMGEDAVEVCRYFASRDRINHMHFRNVTVDAPYDKYVECFIDEGKANLFAVMQEAFKNGYKRGILPEHPHILDYDREHGSNLTGGGMAGGGGGGGYAADVFNVAFARGIMWSVMSV